MPQEMQHFTDCVRENREAIETGRDGRVSLEVIYAAYRSAAEGRRIEIASFDPLTPAATGATPT